MVVAADTGRSGVERIYGRIPPQWVTVFSATHQIQKIEEPLNMTSAAPRRAGRPSNAAKAAAAAAAANHIDHDEERDEGDYGATSAPLRRNRPDPRAQVREPVRQETRQASRAGGEIIGRNGEKLTRSRKSSSDPFEITPDMIPKGWSYQWNTVTTLNATEADRQRVMYENGWRPVPMDRYPGRFGPVGDTGDITRDGLRLEERPIELTMEAQQEAIDFARRQVTSQNEQLGLAAKKAMPAGFNAGDVRGTGVRTLGVEHAPEPEAHRGGYEYRED